MPNEKGTEHNNENAAITVALYEEYIIRTHRSHKPYQWDGAVDKKFKEKFIEAWTNKDNDTYEKICK